MPCWCVAHCLPWMPTKMTSARCRRCRYRSPDTFSIRFASIRRRKGDGVTCCNAHSLCAACNETTTVVVFYSRRDSCLRARTSFRRTGGIAWCVPRQAWKNRTSIRAGAAVIDFDRFVEPIAGTMPAAPIANMTTILWPCLRQLPESPSSNLATPSFRRSTLTGGKWIRWQSAMLERAP